MEHIVTAATEGHPANNTVRQRLMVFRSFLTWAAGEGLADLAITIDPALARLRRSYPVTYGKRQGQYRPRWLTTEEKARVLATCQDGSLVGLRDELALRLGFLGVRAAEIRLLTVGDINPHAGTITWLGKGNRPREAAAGPAFLDVLRRYLAQYPNATPEQPLICSRKRGQASQHLQWGTPVAGNGVFRIATTRAAQAGLGHVAPHDLRRSAAGILHRAKGADGGHRFDLLDIQKVLGHADPATTMRSYLDPMDTGVYERAATELD
jgi:integrase